MFKTNLHIAWRSLWKHRGYTFINITGLSVSLSGFVLLMLLIHRETSYDKWDPRLARVVRLEMSYEHEGKTSIRPQMPYLFANLVQESCPEVERVTRVLDRGKRLILFNKSVFYDNHLLRVDSNFFTLFPFHFLYGDPVASMGDPNSIVLTKKTSEKIFGVQNPIGRVIEMEDGGKKMVTGVVDTDNQLSHFEFDACMPSPPAGQDDLQLGNFNFRTYFLLKPGVDKDRFRDKAFLTYLAPYSKYITRFALKYNKDKKANTDTLANTKAAYMQLFKDNLGLTNMELIAEPIARIHLFTPTETNTKWHTILILAALTFFLLMIACINFTNLSIATAGKRAKEVGMRKVMGSPRSSLALQFLSESFLQTFGALIVALLLIETVMPWFNLQFNTQLVLKLSGNSLQILGWLFLIVVFVTLLAGGYPAVFLSGFQPAKVLKGNFSASHKGKWLRNALLVVQFSVAIVFIAGLLIVRKQINYMRTKDIGVQPQQVLAVRWQQNEHWQMSDVTFDAVRRQLQQVPGVVDVARSDSYLWNDLYSSGDTHYGDIEFQATRSYGDYNYLSIVGTQLLAGRPFSRSIASDSVNGVIINQTAAARLNVKDPIGKEIKTGGNAYTIIGVVKDFNTEGFEKEVRPGLYFTYPQNNYFTPFVLIRLQAGDVKSTLNGVAGVFRKMEPAFPMRSVFLSDAFNKMMESYDQLLRLFTLFSMLTLVVCVMGLFALAAFSALQRTREIAVRKVLGASLVHLMTLLNKEFVRQVMLANLVAWPVIYLLAMKWLNTFAYRMELNAWPFVGAAALSLAVAVLTVSVRAWRVAAARPAEALKYE